LTEEALQN